MNTTTVMSTLKKKFSIDSGEASGMSGARTKLNHRSAWQSRSTRLGSRSGGFGGVLWAQRQQQRWGWWAIAPARGQVLADILAEHKDDAFLGLKALWEPFGMSQFYRDGWGADERQREPVLPPVGKQNTQLD